MARSDSSDSGRSSRKHSKSRRRNKHHSRSDSSSSDERSRKSKKSKSDRRRSRSRDRKRSRSRERKKSRSRSRDRKRSRSRSRDRKRSHSRDRKKTRSRSRERKKSRSRSLERKKNRLHDRHRSPSRSRSRGSRSLSKEKSRKAKERSVSPPLKHIFSGREDTGKAHLKSVTGWDAKPTDLNLDEEITDSLSLKEKVKLIAGQTNLIENSVIPTSEEIGKIENQNFVQERFSSTYIDPSNQPKQKKKKKNKQKNQQTISVIKDEPTKEERMELISHENAMFGTTADTLHVSRFSSRIDVKRKEELKTVQADDLIFGAMFFDNPEVRMKRWIKKLKNMRERILEKQ